MNELTLEQIELLRQKAEEERAIHRAILNDIAAMGSTKAFEKKTLSCERQMEIVKRGRVDEIIPMLEMYAMKSIDDPTNNLSEDVELFIYEDDSMSSCRDNLLQNINHGAKLAVIMLEADRLPCQRFKKQGEIALLDYMVFANDIKRVKAAKYMMSYLEMFNYLEDEAAGHLLDLLKESNVSDSTIDVLHNLVLYYIGKAKRLNNENELKLILSGHHKAILHYIEVSIYIISDKAVLQALFDRRNKEEIEAYFKRYAQE